MFVPWAANSWYGGVSAASPTVATLGLSFFPDKPVRVH